MKFCQSCGAEINENAVVCVNVDVLLRQKIKRLKSMTV